MHSYQEVKTPGDMELLLSSINSFHDSMTKEIHMVNRGYVSADHSMNMDLRFDAQVLIQSQWDPFAVELLFTNITKFHVDDAGEYWGASAKVEQIQRPVERQQVNMRFDSSLTIVAEQLFYRFRSEWLGKQAFLGAEVPSAHMGLAARLGDDWRQCPVCSDAWKKEDEQEISLCPNCGATSQLKSEIEVG